MSTLPSSLGGPIPLGSSYETVATLVSDAAIELGLITAAIADPYASTDPNIIQLLAFLKSAGQEIVREREWTQLQKEYTTVTVAGQSDYGLPIDFRNMISQTGWNRTTRFPLGGPTSPQEWQYLKARLTGVVFTILFRPIQGIFRVYPDTSTPGGQTIAFEYVSNWWVSATGQTVPDKESPSAKDDIVYFLPLLVRRKLKLEYLKAKGFDTSLAQADYDTILAAAKDEDGSAPILRLDGRSTFRPDKMLGPDNFPVTNYGS